MYDDSSFPSVMNKFYVCLCKESSTILCDVDTEPANDKVQSDLLETRFSENTWTYI